MDDFVKLAKQAMDNPTPQDDIICTLQVDKNFGFAIWTWKLTRGNVNELPNSGYIRAGVTKRKVRGVVRSIAIDYCPLNDAPSELTVMELRTIANRVARYVANGQHGTRGLFDD